MFDFENTPITKYTKLKAQYNCGPQPVLTYYGDWARITLTGGATLELSSEAELNTLLASTTSATVAGQTVNVADITRLEFGIKVTTVPTHSVHLDAWSKLKTINGFHEGFKKIGDYCFTPSNGDGWGNLKGNTIVLPSTMTGVGQLFLCACGDGNLTVIVNCPATVFSTTNPTYMLGAYEPNNPQYVNGIKIRGAYAQDFVAKFPNRSSVPYRNLYAESNSLSDFKSMLDAGLGEIYYPVGSEIKDSHSILNAPLLVAQYLHSGNNSAYGGAEGAILIRKYTSNIGSTWGNTPLDYSTSVIHDYLNSTYLNDCSNALKGIISEISVPWYSGTSMVSITTKWFLMSAYEVIFQGSYGVSGNEGIMWDYWRQKTGLTTPQTSIIATAGRKVYKNSSGTESSTWLRTIGNSTQAYEIKTSGAIEAGYTSPTNTSKVFLPACFVPGVVNPPRSLTSQNL